MLTGCLMLRSLLHSFFLFTLEMLPKCMSGIRVRHSDYFTVTTSLGDGQIGLHQPMQFPYLENRFALTLAVRIYEFTFCKWAEKLGNESYLVNYGCRLAPIDCQDSAFILMTCHSTAIITRLGQTRYFWAIL